MPGRTRRICAKGGGEFDCYLVAPEAEKPVAAVVLASAIHGVDADMRAIAEELATYGVIVAVPDLFWRSIAGPLSRDDQRAAQRSQPRLEQIRVGEADMADTLRHLGTLPQFNGQAAVMGFCYGGPYAILGPKRLGYAAGICCHGSQMLDYLHELVGVREQVCLIWGDQDNRAPVEVLEAYRDVAARMANVEVHIFPGVRHGYMMRGNPAAFDRAARDFSIKRAREVLAGLDGALC
ncbi:dienelactone hydrolase family protein [Bradyrhizobium manausense]|uniref:dienelactone hydrolase family protein n=1 Tax=Bradyrhizobium manausense TaxID=989370 RepID=UPI001BA74E1D|nr:dienelactone hydrolase family protein [Bradyrhizobium manausense]MBR0691332.1 dienelactone hydrolase family protein [Bradyrhizobium manausense]MBR0725340.1 dienelactone hydrolase family protein [Bradyrhizobium manausense]